MDAFMNLMNTARPNKWVTIDHRPADMLRRKTDAKHMEGMESKRQEIGLEPQQEEKTQQQEGIKEH